MVADVRIMVFGKDGWPYTEKAIRDLTTRQVAYSYLDVQKDKKALKQMLEYSGGKKEVPVIVEGGKVSIGYGGSWGV